MKKVIVIITIISLLNLIGYYSYQKLSREELSRLEENRRIQVINKSKYSNEFNTNRGERE
ncbi:MAG: hypothetical protein KJN64_07745 [Ignavibacteria bacterium]|nr:hypothetical protein [Ignavibacteria bacterium]MBT8383755.1 hypothetical protein [Ignavibacteria bacterium]MBT8392548.1 hypothetical protein [Ignavibacteria bacterium]NNJ52360.1 hypothetical protein [Ignavibacteriaceae bacterium]NNL20477.1 hypothetical protein [Ignavibacteriaceae bacterium]